MTKAAKPVPAGYHTVTPYLACGDAARAIELYKKAFGADEVMHTEELPIDELKKRGEKAMKETGG